LLFEFLHLIFLFLWIMTLGFWWRLHGICRLLSVA
jgi:hypothetical protein